MQTPKTNPTRVESTTSTHARLVSLQIILPTTILVGVLIYSGAFEFVVAESLPTWFHFGLEVIIFGVFGAALTFFALEYVRRHLRAEEKRQSLAHAQERQLAAITTYSADAIIFLDNDGIIREWNRGAEFLFGYTPPEIVGKHFSVLLPADLRENELVFLQKEIGEHGAIHKYLTRRLTKDGRELIVELTRTLLKDENGVAIGSSAILRDVTERERVQQQIRELNRQLEIKVTERTRELSEANRRLYARQHELEEANTQLQELDKLKSEFVSLASHELRAPLANISGVFQLLLDDVEHLSTGQREIVGIAEEQVQRLARLVKGILNVSRIEAGEMEFMPQAFDLLDLIERVCQQWAASDATHHYVAPTTHNLPSVWADRDRVEEVLTNLLDNAKKYSSEHTDIRLETRVTDAHVIVSVSDQGSGIASDDLEKIFDKFHRVERDDARQTYGHGLGLYISRKLIQAMNGDLWAESQPGKGSQFYFSLPLAGHHSMLMEGAPASVRNNGHSTDNPATARS